MATEDPLEDRLRALEDAVARLEIVTSGLAAGTLMNDAPPEVMAALDELLVREQGRDPRPLKRRLDAARDTDG